METRADVERLIAELEKQSAQALKVLVSFRAEEKKLTREVERLHIEVGKWEARAMDAVRSGDDELAKKALANQKQMIIEKNARQKECQELASTCSRELAAKKEFDRKLESLKLRKNSIARDLGTARGQQDPMVAADAAFEKLDEIEARIDEQAIVNNIDEILDDGKKKRADADLDQATRDLVADDALAKLKEKMGK